MSQQTKGRDGAASRGSWPPPGEPAHNPPMQDEDRGSPTGSSLPLERIAHGCLLSALFLCSFSIALMQIALGLALLAWLVDMAKHGARGRAFPLWKPFAAFALASLLSACFAADPGRALASLPETLLPAIVFLAAQDFARRERAERAIDVCLAAGGIAALVGLAQTLRHGAEYRIHGTLGHYMTFSGVLLTASLVAWGRLLFATERRQRVYALAVLVMTLAALLMTHTRSAWIGWLAGGALALSLRRRAALLVLPPLALVLYFLAPQAVRERVESTFDAKNVTVVERQYMWRSGTALWMDHFWLGVGPANLRAAYPAYKLPDDPWLPERKFTHLHNNLLQVAAERGALSLAAWLWIWWAWLFAAARAWRSTPDSNRQLRGWIAASAAALVGFHVSGLFEYDFGNSEVVTLAWIIAALPLARAATSSRTDASMSGHEPER